MTLTSEQQKMADLATGITKLGGRVLSLVPNDDLTIRFQVWANDDERIIGELKSWGWAPSLTGSANSFNIVTYSTVPTKSYSLSIPVERAAVPPDQPFGELSKGKKSV